MKIEDQDVSLDLAQEMKDLGVKQDSASAWYQYVNGKPYIALKAFQNCQDSIATYHDGYAECPKEICDAPTVAELGEMLPEWITSKKTSEDKFFVQSEGPAYYNTLEKKEADARAKMWLFLKKEGLL